MWNRNKILKFNSDFTKHVFILVMGTVVTQIIPILVSPILTRIYSPEFFGVFALFMALTAIFVEIANGRYDLAIMQPKNKIDAYNIFILGVIISVFFSLILLCVVFIFNGQIAQILNNTDAVYWLYFIPLSVFLYSLFNLLNYFNIREKNYYDIRNANIIRSLIMVILQISIGLIKPSFIGLIASQLISQFFSITKLFKNVSRDIVYSENVSFDKIKHLAMRYRKYPMYSTWSSLLNTASMHLPIMVLSSFYGLTVAGLYALAIRIVGAPLSIIGTSFGQVFYQKSCDLRNNGMKISDITFRTCKKLMIISIIPFSFLISSSDIIFGAIFGSDWSIAGKYVQIFSLWFLLVFIASPLSTLLDTLEMQKQSLYFNVAIFLSRILSLILGGIWFDDVYYTISIYGLVGFFCWFLFFIYLLRISGVSILKVMSVTFFCLLLGVVFGCLCRFVMIYF